MIVSTNYRYFTKKNYSNSEAVHFWPIYFSQYNLLTKVHMPKLLGSLDCAFLSLGRFPSYNK